MNELDYLDEIMHELRSLREELSYLAHDVQWLANEACVDDAARERRKAYLSADADRRIALTADSDAIGRAKIRERLALRLSTVVTPDGAVE